MVDCNHNENLTVVGIGASAGGLDALERFFSNVPEHTGMAFVVVQHLSPTFKSLMHELLARFTHLPIHRVENSMVVEPDAIYLIPPGQNMLLNNGHLLLNDQDTSVAPQLPIDIFFRSLAHDCGPSSVAVVLSGTGSDGSRGIMDVHQAGGLVVVQSPDSAGFDGMPRNALAKDIVDIVASPENMPQLIADRLAGINTENSEDDEQDSLFIATVNDSDFGTKSPPDLVALFSLLRRRYQVDFSLYKPATMLRRIERRMTVLEIDSLGDYVKAIAQDPDEQEVLFRDFLVEVTEFFRNPPAFHHLETSIMTLLSEKRPDGIIRAWVAGCATGEEAYSLAILFDRCLRQLSQSRSSSGDEDKHTQAFSDEHDSDIQIFATDIHQGSLAIAAKGSYPLVAIEHLTPHDIDEYFDLHDTYCTVKPELRKMVVFAPHNMLQDPPFTRLDLVSCRNVLIYLNSISQEKVLSRFHFGLKSGGILFLGSSEHLAPAMAQDFRAVNTQWRIFRKESESTRFYSPPATLNTNLRPVIAERRLDRNRMMARNELYESLLESIMPPSLLLDNNYTILHIFGSAGEYLNLTGEASLNVLEIVDHTLAIALRSGLHRASVDMETITYSDLKLRQGEHEVRRVQLRIHPIKTKNSNGLSFLVALVPLIESHSTSSDENGIEQNSDREDRGRETDSSPWTAEGSSDRSSSNSGRSSAYDPDAENMADPESPASEAKTGTDGLMLIPPKENTIVEFVPGQEAASHIAQLERELQHTREYLHTAVEELETTNEELQSANEELIASNEELQSTNEELQSVNEELHTVNLEHQQKILELQQLNTDIRNLQRSTRMAVLFLDQKRHIRSYSDMAGTLFSLLPQDVGRPLQQIYLQIGLLPEELDELARQVLATAEIREEEITIGELPHIMRILPYETSENAVDGVVLVFYDISQLKAAQAEKAASEARFRTLVDSATDSIIVCNPQGEILEVNQEACMSLRLDKSELLQMNMSDIEQRWNHSEFPQILNAKLKSDRRFTFNGIHMRSDGTEIPVENQVAHVVYDDEKAFLLLCRDITQRSESEKRIHYLNAEISERAELLKQANEQLVASNTELDRFVQIAAHDLKEPLRGLEHYAHMLEQRPLLQNDEETKSYVTSIRRLSHRMNLLINDLRIYGRLDKEEFETTQVDLNEVIKVVKDNLHALIKEHHATLNVKGRLPAIEYYEHHATLIFQNLISNAIKYNDNEKKRIDVEQMTVEDGIELLPDDLNLSELRENAIICAIKDNGIGIPERHQEKIFDMFRRLHIQDAYGGGTGAGLALVKKVIELNGGRIWLSSHPGEGTTFYFIL